MDVTITGVRGEPKRAAIVSEDLRTRSFAKVIPFPIEARDGPCRLSVETALPAGQAFVVAGEGFEPDEEVEVTDQSEDEVMKHKDKADATGKLGALLFPAVAGKESGAASWTVQGRACLVKVQYNWGRAAFEFQ